MRASQAVGRCEGQTASLIWTFDTRVKETEVLCREPRTAVLRSHPVHNTNAIFYDHVNEKITINIMSKYKLNILIANR